MITPSPAEISTNIRDLWDQCATLTTAIHYALDAGNDKKVVELALSLKEASHRLHAYTFLNSRREQHG